MKTCLECGNNIDRGHICEECMMKIEDGIPTPIMQKIATENNTPILQLMEYSDQD